MLGASKVCALRLGAVVVLAAVGFAGARALGVSADAVSGLLGVLAGGSLVVMGQFQIATQDRRNQLRLVAAERRLATHQEGYQLWRSLVASAHQRDAVGEVVLRCQDWWEKNCLYLDPESRGAFNAAYTAASMHPDLLAAPRDSGSSEMIRENWAVLMSVGQLLAEGVGLPSLGAREYEITGR